MEQFGFAVFQLSFSHLDLTWFFCSIFDLIGVVLDTLTLSILTGQLTPSNLGKPCLF